MADEKELNENEIKEEEVKETQPVEEAKPAEEASQPEKVKEEAAIEQVEEKTAEEKSDSVEGDYNAKRSAPALETAVFTPIKYYNTGSNIDNDVEDLRKSHTKLLSVSKIYDYVSLGVIVLAFVAVLLVMILNRGENSKAWITYTTLGISAGIIIICFIISFVFSKKKNKMFLNYLNDYEDMVSSYFITDIGVEDAKICMDAQINDQLVIEAHYFRVINAIKSRGLLEGNRHNAPFYSAEVQVVIPEISFDEATKLPENFVNFDGSAYVPDENKSDTSTQELLSNDMTIVDKDIASEIAAQKKNKRGAQRVPTTINNGLFGRFYACGTTVSSEESMIISIIGDHKNSVLPSYLTGFTPVKVPNLRSNIVVYLINPKESEKFFTEETVALLNKFVTDTTVFSGFISINSYGAKAALTLSDNVMQLPMRPIVMSGCYESVKDDTDIMFKFIDFVEEHKNK